MTKYEVINREKDKNEVCHPQKLAYPDRMFNLDDLTDEEAEELLNRKSPYIRAKVLAETKPVKPGSLV